MAKRNFKEQIMTGMLNGFLCAVAGVKPVVHAKDLFDENLFGEAGKNRISELEERAIEKLTTELTVLMNKTGE